MNPDGLITVKRWYDATIGTEYEGVNPPFLYHRYAGHDNNRDWFMFTQAETRLVVEHCLNRWHPQIVLDLHQTRSTGMRMILPPLVDPIGPNVDPVLQSQLTMLGSYIASELTTQGKAGVAMNVVYDGYSPSRSYPHYHGGDTAIVRGRRRAHRDAGKSVQRRAQAVPWRVAYHGILEPPAAVEGRPLGAGRHRGVPPGRRHRLPEQCRPQQIDLGQELVRGSREGRDRRRQSFRLPGPGGPGRPQHGCGDAGAHADRRRGGATRRRPRSPPMAGRFRRGRG